MSGRVFRKNGFVYAECIVRNGIEYCHPTGFYKFPVYDKRKTKTDSRDENQSSKEEA